MNISDKGLELIKSFEQFRGTAYKPTPNDVWTLGWGHTKEVKEFDTCSIQQADDWVVEDSQEAADCINHHVTAGINQNQFDSLVSWAFNCGCAALKGSTLLTLINSGAFKEAAEQLLRWDKQKGKVLAGLTKRREAEKALFETKP